MKIQSVHIRNYRKLKNCHIDFGEKETVFVGANNSGKTSAISAIVWFLKNTDRFTLKEFTATNWASINKIGEKWLEHDSVDEALLSSHQWDNIVPSMDVWINVEDGEQYRVNHLIPSLSSWDGKKVGVRGQYEPKDVTKLYTVYKEAKMKAKTLEGTEEWEKAGSPELYPKNLCDFLGKGSNLREYFDVKYYIIDPVLDPDNEDEVQTTPDNEIGNNPLDGLIKVDTILASRDFSDPEGQTDSDIDTLSKQFQQYYKSSGQENEELTCEGLKLLGGIVTANKTYDEKLEKTFEVPVGELRNINYPGFQNPEIKIRSKIQIEEAIKHDSAVQFAIQGMEELVLPEKYNGLGYRNLISIYLKLIDFREKGSGHIAVISSIAGTKGLGVAPAYSATKRFQNTYIEALAQLARMQHLDIHFTDIRPGFVATDLLKSGKYPMLMKADRVAQHIIKALREKRRVVVIDGRYRVLVFFWRMIPRWLWERLPITN